MAQTWLPRPRSASPRFFARGIPCVPPLSGRRCRDIYKIAVWLGHDVILLSDRAFIPDYQKIEQKNPVAMRRRRLASFQVEMTGSSVFDYVHQQDHAEVAEQLGLLLATSANTSAPHSSNSGLASPSSGASEDHGSSSTANPDGNSPRHRTNARI